MKDKYGNELQVGDKINHMDLGVGHIATVDLTSYTVRNFASVGYYYGSVPSCLELISESEEKQMNQQETQPTVPTKVATCVFTLEAAITALRKQYNLGDEFEVKIEGTVDATLETSVEKPAVAGEYDWKDVPEGWDKPYCPTGNTTEKVHVEFRNGSKGFYEFNELGVNWKQEDLPYDIIRYRKITD